MIRLAGEYGVGFERCVEQTGLTRATLADPLTEIEGRQELAVLRNIVHALGPRVPFGLEAGLRYHVTTHGIWGFALVSSPSVRKAIDLALQYFDLTYSFNRVHVEFDGPYLRTYYDSADNPDDLQAILVERDLGALLTLQLEGLGSIIPPVSLELRALAPAYSRRFKSMFGVTPRFGAATNCITVKATYLDAIGPFADEVGVRVGEQQCRKLLEQTHTRSGVAGLVRGRILRTPDRIPSMAKLAAELGISARTLRNHLDREEVSYRELVESIRLILAEELLSAGLSVDAVANRVGYAAAASFSAAFKRWTGVAPGSYRAGTRPSRTHADKAVAAARDDLPVAERSDD